MEHKHSAVTGTDTHTNRQGPYSGDGDIVVLCAYLGQLARVRDALASEVVVVIDERDQRELDDREGEQSGDEPPLTTVERVQVTRKASMVFLTRDNFLKTRRSSSALSTTSKAKRPRYTRPNCVPLVEALNLAVDCDTLSGQEFRWRRRRRSGLWAHVCQTSEHRFFEGELYFIAYRPVCCIYPFYHFQSSNRINGAQARVASKLLD